jgi:ABC-type xylose transport system permease subunit
MNNVLSKVKGNLKQYSMLIALVVIIAFFHVLTGGRPECVCSAQRHRQPSGATW